MEKSQEFYNEWKKYKLLGRILLFPSFVLSYLMAIIFFDKKINHNSIQTQKIETNNIYLGDCLKLMPYIKDKSIDLILTDLPYCSVKCLWDKIIPFKLLWEQYNRIIKDNGAIVLTATEPFASKLRLSNIKYYKYDWVWDKIKGTGFLNAKKQPMRNHELACVFYKKQCTFNPQKTQGHTKKKSFRSADLQTEVYGNMKNNCSYESTERYPRSIITCSTDTQNSSLHPTQKPVELFSYFIKTYTNENGIILDSCAGSGTTGVSAIKTGRRYILIEKEKKYFRISQKRIQKTKESISLLNIKGM